MDDELLFDENSHIYRLGSEIIPNVTSILDAHGLISAFAKDESAALRGSYVHKACYLLARRSLDWHSIDERILGYVRAYEKFLKDTDFSPSQLEARHFHKGYRYCGTLDAFGKSRGIPRLLFDIKTGVPARYHALQTSAYAAFFAEGVGRATLFLHEDGRYNLRFHKDRTDWNEFLSCLNVLRLPDSDAHRKYQHYLEGVT